MPLEKVDDVLITGGAGAIGSRLVETVLRAGAASVTVVDDLSSGYSWLLKENPKLRVHRQDVCRIDSLGIDAVAPTVFHLAAFFANQNSVDHPADDLHTNGLGTLKVLEWARSRKARRVVYASAGCSIAGHDVEGPVREDMPVSLHLDTPYQITKALGEFYCNYFNDQVSTVRCRFFNSFGPGEVPGRYRNVIPNFIWKAMHNQDLIITGTGKETRDFIYVDDLVDGLLRAATTPGAHGQAINLGTGVETPVIEIAEAVLKATRSSSKIVYGERRSWDKSLRRQASIERAKSVLGFSPRIGVREGIERTVEWFRENRERIAESVRGAL